MGSGLPLQAAAPAGGLSFPCELCASHELLICKQNQLITAGNLSSCKAGRQHDCLEQKLVHGSGLVELSRRALLGQSSEGNTVFHP